MTRTIFITEADLAELRTMIDRAHYNGEGLHLADLEAELKRARIVPAEDVPRDVVTMNSRVVFENETTGERREVTLVFPANADIEAGRISVLVPVGTALLGLRAGQSIDWELPGGEKQRYRIVKVPFQPEAAGEAG